MKKYKALIIDDERLARRELFSMLNEFENIEIVGEADDVPSATIAIEKLNPDLLFLDIQMPGASGFDLLEKVDFSGDVIFVTAYDEYAMRAFEVNALDYLLKPISHQRLEKTLERLKTGVKVEELRKNLTVNDRLFIMVGTRMKFMKVSDIICITSSGDYSNITLNGTQGGLVLKSMHEWEIRLPENTFCRIHRSAIINMEFVEKVEKWFNYSYRVNMKNVAEPIVISRRYIKKLKDMMG